MKLLLDKIAARVTYYIIYVAYGQKDYANHKQNS